MINQRLYQHIKHLLHKQLQQPSQPISIGKTLHRFLEEWSIGNLVKSARTSSVKLNSEHCLRLRKLVITTTGCDPLTDNLPHTRLAMAKLSKDEKMAGNQVFSRYLQVASSGPIHLTNALAQTAPGTILSLFDNAIDWSQYKDVIIVENGEAIINWHLAQLPSDLNQALFIYRGHGINARQLNQILNEAQHIKRIGFYDIDPAGLKLAHQANVDELLVPKNWNQPTQPVLTTIESNALLKKPCLNSSISNSSISNSSISNSSTLNNESFKQRYFIQYDQAIPYLNQTVIAQQPFFKWLVKHRISLSQEWLLVNQQPLTTLKLNNH